METRIDDGAGAQHRRLKEGVEIGGEQKELDGESYWTIGELAREFGISLRTLRFYVYRGFLLPNRKGFTRLFAVRDRLYLQMILKCNQLGVTLTEIHDMLK